MNTQSFFDTLKSENYTLRELTDMSQADPEYVVDGLILRSAVTVICGVPKSGKSFLTADLALAVATGQPFLGRETTQGATQMILLEGSVTRDLGRRLRRLMHGRQIEDAPVFINYGDLQDNQRGWETLTTLVEKNKPSLLVIDPLVAFISEVGDENSSQYIRTMFRRLERLAVNYNIAVVIVHHPRKAAPGENHASISGRGSGDILAAPDAQLLVTYDRRTGLRTLTQGCIRCGIDDNQGIGFRLVDEGESVVVETLSDYKGQDRRPSSVDLAKTALLEVLADGEYVKAGDAKETVMTKVNCKSRTVSVAIAELETAGKVDKSSKHGHWRLMQVLRDTAA